MESSTVFGISAPDTIAWGGVSSDFVSSPIVGATTVGCLGVGRATLITEGKSSVLGWLKHVQRNAEKKRATSTSKITRNIACANPLAFMRKTFLEQGAEHSS